MATGVKVKLLKDQRGQFGEHLPIGTIIDATLVDPSTIQFGFFNIDPAETCLISGKAYKQFFGQIYDEKTKRCRKTKWND